MWSDFQLQAGLSGMKAIGSFIVNRRQYKSEKAWQDYNNKMTRLQNAGNQNNLTQNEGMLIERTVREKYNTAISRYKTSASATVAAAAVGAEGNSVDMVLVDIARNESRAQQRIQQDFEYNIQGIRNQQQQSNLQTEMQIDYKQLPEPSIATSLLDWGAKAATSWWENEYGVRGGNERL